MTSALPSRAVMVKLFESCKRLLLPISTTLTALITAHRYLESRSNECFPKNSESVHVAAICFLSCKLDEHTRSLRDVIGVVREVYRCGLASEEASARKKPDLYEEELAYPSLREAVIAQEQVLLRVTGFQTEAPLPHKYLLNMARSLSLSCQVVHYSFALLNDCFLHPGCLSMSEQPLVLAAACLHLGILFVSHCPPPAKGSDLSDTAPPARCSLKAPGHPMQLSLQGAWWESYGVSSEPFRDAVRFVVLANGEQGTSAIPST